MATERKTAKYQEVVTKIREKVMVTKELAPGDRLPDERTMALEYGVSRTSIREAVKILNASGILVVKKALGIFVADNPGLTSDPLGMGYIQDRKQLMDDWYAIRLALEPAMMEAVAKNATDEELQEILQLEREEARAFEEGKKDFLELDKQFHAMLAKATHNSVMERLIPTLQAPIYYQMAEERMPLEVKKEALLLHESITKFLKLRDATGAALAMRYHLLSAAGNTKYFAEED